jgi:hypothetical protein
MGVDPVHIPDQIDEKGACPERNTLGGRILVQVIVNYAIFQLAEHILVRRQTGGCLEVPRRHRAWHEPETVIDQLVFKSPKEFEPWILACVVSAKQVSIDPTFSARVRTA